MAKNETYEDILTSSWDDIPVPQLLPGGSWELKALGATFKKAQSDDKSDQVNFTYEPTDPLSDVSDAALEELGADYDYANNKLFAQFFVANPSDWDRVRKHIIKHGVDLTGLTLEEGLKAVRGKRINGHVSTRQYVDKNEESVTVNQVKDFVAVTD